MIKSNLVHQVVKIKSLRIIFDSFQKMAASPLRPKFDMRLVNLDKFFSVMSGYCRTCRREIELENCTFMKQDKNITCSGHGAESGNVRGFTGLVFSYFLWQHFIFTMVFQQDFWVNLSVGCYQLTKVKRSLIFYLEAISERSYIIGSQVAKYRSQSTSSVRDFWTFILWYLAS